MRGLELKVPPPIVALVTAVLMWLTSRSLPLFAFVFPARNAFAIGLAAAGFIIGISGVVTFRRAKTTVNPTKPQASSSLVTWGVYTITRNPMYLGMTLVLVGEAVWLGTATPWLVFPVFLWLITTRFIRHEEAMLEQRFGAQYREYKSRVRRWV